MPNIKSASKRLRQNKKRKAKNFSIKFKIKEINKDLIKNLSDDKSDEAKKTLSLYFKVVDKAISKGILKKNTGARKKSNAAKSVFSKKTSSLEDSNNVEIDSEKASES